ncbi:hypothetical protein NSK_003877 [Nannochloropsis salina CCMP1776]|uniref:Elongation of fatty acids protein n=1 Tax=Nannochloropsis salina CCMP1776 TaxID=1027361 RepID=A0A4D9D5V2_9STRA|nr:hypothetical protein NSK_003877 [Nannochloropsis salina CCMP1776]|eukprot:TFJ84845.1 hypothetical protein NSK_003877 [Nannochloropsis salina CCMP1776]
MPSVALPAWLWRDPRPLYASSRYKTADPESPVRFVQVFQSLPWLGPFYMEWEKNFDVSSSFQVIRDNQALPIVATILYLSFLIEGKKYVERRRREGKGPINLGLFPAFWNAFLAAFSVLGATRVVPHFLFLFTHKDFKTTVCEAPDKAGYGDGAAGLWVMLFTVSKLFELVDTVILVLKGKDPMFLHWYHHVTVLLYTWFSYSARNPGIYFVAMNYSVHALMYSYYFLMELRLWPKWFSPMWITMAQILQMLVGVGITVSAFVFSRDPSCALVRGLIPWCAAMYATYLYFFVLFFLERFFPAFNPAAPGAARGLSGGKAGRTGGGVRRRRGGESVPAAGGGGRRQRPASRKAE